MQGNVPTLLLYSEHLYCTVTCRHSVHVTQLSLRPRDPPARGPGDVPRHLERAGQPDLRGGDPGAAQGGGVVPQQLPGETV